MSYFRRFRDYAISGILLALPFFFLRAHLQDPSELGVIDRAFLQVSSPIQYVAHQVADGISSVLEEYVYLIEVREENERLSEELSVLRQQAYELRAVSAENQRLTRLLALRQRIEGDALAARVIGREISPFFRVTRVRIDRGQANRVSPGMPVVSAQGLVGQIERVYDDYADITLTVDQRSKIDVVSERSGARGILRGTGEGDRYLSRIQYLQRSDEIEVGDEIYTSGLGRRFPASILVGRVTRVEVRNDSGLNQLVEVTPSVDFSSLDEVLILTEGARSSGIVELEP